MSEDSIEGQKSIWDELQHCSAESEAKKVETLNINDTETVHHTDSLDSFELIDYPDPDEIEIAGFNKKKLLKMCTFSKITYGNNDIKLSEAVYKTKAEFIKEGYNIIPFYHTNGTLAGFVFTKDREITIAYRGTQGFDDIMTDINAWLTILEFLSEGGRVHYGFYNSFKDSRKCLADIIKTYSDEQKLEIKDFKFYLTGHSMGGAIAKIAALFLSKVIGAQDLHVATFADPRVFDLTASEIYNKALPNRTVRVTQHRCDPVPAVAPGFLGYVHVGTQLRISVMPEYTVHKIDGYYQAINMMQESDFQPDIVHLSFTIFLDHSS
ncbi:lipase family protein [Candidatus Mesenet endosymbiont of Phosphuga atrata]|uniref:lipase family protein n=1 Tax=Candidatus Mesenet endosymbiont of Phosphuga atrata TaxID=3066221 RepID=UPI0030D2E532